jgi:hypothetical protein
MFFVSSVEHVLRAPPTINRSALKQLEAATALVEGEGRGLPGTTAKSARMTMRSRSQVTPTKKPAKKAQRGGTPTTPREGKAAAKGQAKPAVAAPTAIVRPRWVGWWARRGGEAVSWAGFG